MSNLGPNEINNREHISPDTTGDNIAAKKTAQYVWNGSAWVRDTGGTSAALPSTIVYGQQTVTTSAVALPNKALTQGVILESLSTNTVSIFIGDASVTTSTGVELQVGAALSAAVNNLDVLYVICASTSPVISWIGS